MEIHVVMLHNVVEIMLKRMHNIIKAKDGSVKCWGPLSCKVYFQHASNEQFQAILRSLISCFSLIMVLDELYRTVSRNRVEELSIRVRNIFSFLFCRGSVY